VRTLDNFMEGVISNSHSYSDFLLTGDFSVTLISDEWIANLSSGFAAVTSVSCASVRREKVAIPRIR